MTSKTRLLALLLGGIALIPVILALQLITSGTKTLHETVGAATIDFSAARRIVAIPGDCVSVHWHVEHIKAVYIDGVPTIGEGQQPICVDRTTMPTLRIKFEDGSQQDFTLTINVLAEQPSTWLLLVGGVLLVLTLPMVAISRPAAAAIASDRHVSPIMTIFATIGLILTAVIILLVVAELAVRFYFTTFGSNDDKVAYLYSRTEIDQRMKNPGTALPFVGYSLVPNAPGHNALGYRGDEIQIPKPPGVYRIVVMGDSTTYGIYSPYDQTFPAYLQKVLRSDVGYPQVEVINGGVSGYTSWNILANLASRTVALQPDLVIVYEGGNDVDPREVSPRCYNAPSPYLGLDPRHEQYIQRAELSPSALYRLIAVNLGWIPDPRQFIITLFDTKYSCYVPADEKTQARNVEANPPTYFERNVREMIGIAQADRIPIMFATWAYNPNDSNLEPFWRTAVAENNAIIARVAQANGALFLDYAAAAPMDKQLWVDGKHMNPEGNMRQAQIFAQYLVAQGVIPKPNPAG